MNVKGMPEIVASSEERWRVAMTEKSKRHTTLDPDVHPADSDETAEVYLVSSLTMGFIRCPQLRAKTAMMAALVLMRWGVLSALAMQKRNGCYGMMVPWP